METVLENINQVPCIIKIQENFIRDIVLLVYPYMCSAFLLIWIYSS